MNNIMQLPPNPFIYEINTWVWLAELGEDGQPLPLDQLPAHVWDSLADLGMDAVWLMGVWERSPRGRTIAMEHEGLMAELNSALPDLNEADVVGSAYCIQDYHVDARLGGDAALAVAREELSKRGIGLLLDFVPNHTAQDHPWAGSNPEYYIQGDAGDLDAAPEDFVRCGEAVIAHGRDPYFPAWTDTAQLNAFAPGYRRATEETLSRLATMCDGVRCDMAMLLISDIFATTWGERAGARPEVEFWVDVIETVKAHAPQFRFIAEAYWETEYTLQQQGFDFCYDKRLYDRLLHAQEGVRPHLSGDRAYQEGLLRFVENHDEPRAAAAIPDAQAMAALVLVLVTPGATLLHEGQLEGRRVRVPVQLGRRPLEAMDKDWYSKARHLLSRYGPVFRRGRWNLLTTSGWEDNQSHQRLIAYSWEDEAGNEPARLVVVNLSPQPSQGLLHTGWEGGVGAMLMDPIANTSYRRGGAELAFLFVDLPAYGVHFFTVQQ